MLFSKVCHKKFICVKLATDPFSCELNLSDPNVSFPGLWINVINALRILDSKLSMSLIEVRVALEYGMIAAPTLSFCDSCRISKFRF